MAHPRLTLVLAALAAILLATSPAMAEPPWARQGISKEQWKAQKSADKAERKAYKNADKAERKARKHADKAARKADKARWKAHKKANKRQDDDDERRGEHVDKRDPRPAPLPVPDRRSDRGDRPSDGRLTFPKTRADKPPTKTDPRGETTRAPKTTDPRGETTRVPKTADPRGEATRAPSKRGTPTLGTDTNTRTTPIEKTRAGSTKSAPPAPSRADVLAEKRKHTERMARITRLGQVGEEMKNADVVKQARELAAKELARHRKALAR